MIFNKLRYTGLAAVIIEYSAIIYFLFATKQPLRLSGTISDYGAIDATKLVFSTTIMTAAILFALFGFWLSKKLHLHRNFLVVFYIGAVSQVLLSWLPNVGQTALWHNLFAFIVMIAMPAAVHYYSIAVKNNTARFLFQGVFWSQIVALILFPFSIQWHVPLLPEVITSISFQLWAIVATFKS